MLVFLASSLLLLVLSFNWRAIYLSDYISYHPLQCDGEPGAMGLELIGRLQGMGYPGLQLSYSSATGRVFDCAAGWGKRELPSEPVSLSSRFRYASISKIFTAMVALALAKKGVISDNEKLVNVLGLQGPFLDPRMKAVTLGNLLRHRGGFARWERDPMLVADPWCPRDPAGLQHLRLDYSPGQRFAYSNLGYCLLGSALAKATHESERELIEDWLQASLGSVHSIGVVKRGRYLERDVKLYPNAAERLDSLGEVNYASLVSVGGWLGSATDLRVLGESIYQNYIRRTATRQQEWGDAVCELRVLYSCHGKVFYLFRGDRGKLMFFHDGSLPGVTSFLGVFEDGSVLVFLANSRPVKNRPNEDVVKVLYDFAN